MWREYFGFAGTALAVINGLIAITIALLPMRRSVSSCGSGPPRLVLGALAVGATFYAKYRAYVQVERQQSDRAEIRMRLENFITEGRTLLGQIRDADRQLPTTAADEWAQRAEIFLRDKLGERYHRPVPQGRERALRRRRQRCRSANGLLARGAQSRRQSGSDRRGIRRAAAAAAINEKPLKR